MAIDIPRFSGFDLGGKRAVVFGASRGIGLASAAALAQAGASVTVAARSADDLKELRAGLEADGHAARPVVMDATDRAAVDAVFSEHGPFDIVVNSVGSNRLARLEDVLDEDLHAIIDLNIKAAFYIARAAVRSMLSSQIQGSIITISSVMGLGGNIERSVYAATKHAVEGMTKSLAWEVGKSGIRANTICPTFIETALAKPILERPGVREWAESSIALGRVGRLDEVMGPIVFLASDASSLVTGASIAVDGGWTAR